MTDAEFEQFKDIVNNGLAKDILNADRSLSVLKVFGSASYLDNTLKLVKYNDILNSIYYSHEFTFLMALSRIYDSQSKQYQIRSLSQLASFLTMDYGFLQKIQAPDLLISHLTSLNTHAKLFNLVNTEQRNFCKEYSSFIQSYLDDPIVKNTIESLKELRDKSLAHNEKRVIPISGIKWTALETLLDFAKEVVGTIGIAYLSIIYSHQGNYFLTQDARRTGRSFEKMLKQLVS